MFVCDAGTFSTLKDAWDATCKLVDEGFGFLQVENETPIIRVTSETDIHEAMAFANLVSEFTRFEYKKNIAREIMRVNSVS